MQACSSTLDSEVKSNLDIKTKTPSGGNASHRNPNGIKKQTTLFSFMSSRCSIRREKGEADHPKLDSQSHLGSKGNSDSKITKVKSTRRGNNRPCPFYKKIPGNELGKVALINVHHCTCNVNSFSFMQYYVVW